MVGDPAPDFCAKKNIYYYVIYNVCCMYLEKNGIEKNVDLIENLAKFPKCLKIP